MHDSTNMFTLTHARTRYCCCLMYHRVLYGSYCMARTAWLVLVSPHSFNNDQHTAPGPFPYTASSVLVTMCVGWVVALLQGTCQGESGVGRSKSPPLPTENLLEEQLMGSKQPISVSSGQPATFYLC